MKIIYIDNNETVGTTISQLASYLTSISCLSLSNGKKAVVTLIDVSEVPEIIIINCAMMDVSCKSLIQYIRKQQKFDRTKIIVVGDHFTEKEKHTYASLGAEQCVPNWSSIQSVNAFLKSLSGI